MYILDESDNLAYPLSLDQGEGWSPVDEDLVMSYYLWNDEDDHHDDNYEEMRFD